MIRPRLSRFVYRAFLRIHPAPFRERFAGEMLWIFDEESQRGATARLLFDGAISVLRQHAQDQDDVLAAPAGFAAEVAPPAMGLRRLVQGGVVASILAYAFVFFLGGHGAAMVPSQVHREFHSCSPTLCAPAHIRYPPKPPPSGRAR